MAVMKVAVKTGANINCGRAGSEDGGQAQTSGAHEAWVGCRDGNLVQANPYEDATDLHSERHITCRERKL